MLAMFLLAASVDTAQLRPAEVDYIAPIERYLDSTFNSGDDLYDRLIEHRHLREKSTDLSWPTPTVYRSPFTRFDWC